MAVDKLDNRFWYKVDKMGCCWYWIASTHSNGYGQFSYHGKNKLAHRLSYEDKYGDIPQGLVMNHICRTRHCVNPDHLEVITLEKNIQIGISVNRNKTHCKREHEYTEENTHIRSTGFRQCRTCALISKRKYNQRKKLEKFT